MADSATRDLEREGVTVAWLRARQRAGEVSEKALRLAAYLGHPAACELVEPLDPAPGDWRYPAARVLRHGGLAHVDLVRLACDMGERSLPHAGEARGACEAAYAAARAWADCPCEEHVREAAEARAAHAAEAASWAAARAARAARAAEAASWAAAAAGAEREWQAAHLADWLVRHG